MGNCAYCGTTLDDSSAEVAGGEFHFADRCREYVYAVLRSYKRDCERLTRERDELAEEVVGLRVTASTALAQESTLRREREDAVAEARKAIDILAGARARDAGLTINAVREAIGDYENEEISFGKLVEVCRVVAENMSREDIARLSRENEKLRESLRYIAANEVGLTRERDEARAEAAHAKAAERARVVAIVEREGEGEARACEMHARDLYAHGRVPVRRMHEAAAGVARTVVHRVKAAIEAGEHDK